jgi:hypothetical protein
LLRGGKLAQIRFHPGSFNLCISKRFLSPTFFFKKSDILKKNKNILLYKKRNDIDFRCIGDNILS